MTDVASLTWPVSRAVEALEAAARHAGIPLADRAQAAPIWGATELDDADLDRWMTASAAWLGIEAELVAVEHASIESLLLRAAPAVVRVPGQPSVLVVGGRRGRDVQVIGPDLAVRRVPVAALRELLGRAAEAPIAASLDAWLAEVVDAPARRRRTRDVMVDEILQDRPVARCFLVRVPPGASFWIQLRFEGVARRMASLVAAHALQLALTLAGWTTLASGAFGGGVDHAWLAAWALLLASTVPVQIFTLWAQGEVLLGVSLLLKRRLLAGTLRVDQDALRREGAGQLLGRALDATAIEAMAATGGLFALLAVVELAVVAVVLALGPGGVLQLLAFVAWTALTLAIAWRTHLHARRWTHARRDITSDLVEQMVGHRTRLAQQSPARWHDGEDEAHDRYFGLSSSMDRGVALLGAMPQAWYVVGLCTLLPSMLQGGASTGSLAIGIGGMILGGSALARLASGVDEIGAAVIAWREVKPLYDAAARPEVQPSPVFVAAHLMGHAPPPDGAPAPLPDDAPPELPLLDATDLVFSYPGRPQPVLRGGVLRIHEGDRVLLEGPSGGGKSTLASLLAGLRRPQSGLLLLEGLDWQTVGPDGWRRRIAAAPQFHESHVLSDTFLFNVLMGRAWPPSPRDIEEAAEVCGALGLGPLLERMPAGMMQMVGEMGWKLSHGECSRLFIARALLQDAKVIVLDESFAALDPETVEACLRCVLQRAPALVVIAHP